MTKIQQLKIEIQILPEKNTNTILLIGSSPFSSTMSWNKGINWQATMSATTGYVTDIEGNYDYWERYIHISRVLRRSESSSLLELRDNCSLVFGGDVCDRGPGENCTILLFSVLTVYIDVFMCITTYETRNKQLLID